MKWAWKEAPQLKSPCMWYVGNSWQFAMLGNSLTKAFQRLPTFSNVVCQYLEWACCSTFVSLLGGFFAKNMEPSGLLCLRECLILCTIAPSMDPYILCRKCAWQKCLHIYSLLILPSRKSDCFCLFWICLPISSFNPFVHSRAVVSISPGGTDGITPFANVYSWITLSIFTPSMHSLWPFEKLSSIQNHVSGLF